MSSPVSRPEIHRVARVVRKDLCTDIYRGPRLGSFWASRQAGSAKVDLATAATSRTRYQRVTGGIGRFWFSLDFEFLYAITNDGALRWWGRDLRTCI